MRIQIAAMMCTLFGSSAAFALSPEVTAELNRQVANVKIESASYDRIVEQVTGRMRAANTPVPSRRDDGHVLAAMRGVRASIEEMVSFYLAYEEELRPEAHKFDTDVAEMQARVEKFSLMIRAAEQQGAIESIANRRR